MGMMICGVAACQTLDSSGEVLDIKGLDTSTLLRDGVFNYEHEEKLADQIVGKIRYFNKIYDSTDCKTKQEREYWDRIKVPFLWVVGELFDDLGHTGAQNVAAMMRYDERERNERGGYQDDMKPVVNFSIQGGKLNKTGNVVDKSLARKVSITITPANKVAEAEEYKPESAETENKKSSKISDTRSFFDKLLKAETMKVEEMRKDEAPVKPPAPPKAVPAAPAKTPGEPANKPAAPVLASTKTGKPVLAVGHHSNYSEKFSIDDHKEAAAHHTAAAAAAKDPKTAQHHARQATWHGSIAARKAAGPPRGVPGKWSSKHNAASGSKPIRTKQPSMSNDGKQNGYGKLHHPDRSGTATPIEPSKLKKSMEAGSPAQAPGSLVGDAVLQKEDLNSKLYKAEKPKLLGSDSSKEGIVKGISKFYGGSNISLHDAGDGTHHVHNSKGKIEGVHVREHKGRWKFEAKPELNKKEEALQKAEQDASVALATWERADSFKKFLAETRPNMTPVERAAFAKVFALYRVKPQKNKLK